MDEVGFIGCLQNQTVEFRKGLLRHSGIFQTAARGSWGGRFSTKMSLLRSAFPPSPNSIIPLMTNDAQPMTNDQ